MSSLRVLTSPSWMNIFKYATISFNFEPPNYAEITKIISKMKSSTSPCPLDQVSVIAFTKCSILRSHLTKIIQLAWKARTVPKAWKSGTIMLAYRNVIRMDQKTFARSYHNLYYQRYLRQLLEINCINLLKKMAMLHTSKHLRISSAMLD